MNAGRFQSELDNGTEGEAGGGYPEEWGGEGRGRRIGIVYLWPPPLPPNGHHINWPSLGDEMDFCKCSITHIQGEWVEVEMVALVGD